MEDWHIRQGGDLLKIGLYAKLSQSHIGGRWHGGALVGLYKARLSLRFNILLRIFLFSPLFVGSLYENLIVQGFYI